MNGSNWSLVLFEVENLDGENESEKLFTAICIIWCCSNFKKICGRPWQDLNLQSPVSETDALSIRPQGRAYQPSNLGFSQLPRFQHSSSCILGHRSSSCQIWRYQQWATGMLLEYRKWRFFNKSFTVLFRFLFGQSSPIIAAPQAFDTMVDFHLEAPLWWWWWQCQW